MNASQDWFPGRDYPDREVWLKIRAPRVSTKARLIHDSASGPLVFGINAAKRASDAGFALAYGSKHPAKHGSRVWIVQGRHAYYRRAA